MASLTLPSPRPSHGYDYSDFSLELSQTDIFGNPTGNSVVFSNLNRDSQTGKYTIPLTDSDGSVHNFEFTSISDLLEFCKDNLVLSNELSDAGVSISSFYYEESTNGIVKHFTVVLSTSDNTPTPFSIHLSFERHVSGSGRGITIFKGSPPRSPAFSHFKDMKINFDSLISSVENNPNLKFVENPELSFVQSNSRYLPIKVEETSSGSPRIFEGRFDFLYQIVDELRITHLDNLIRLSPISSDLSILVDCSSSFQQILDASTHPAILEYHVSRRVGYIDELLIKYLLSSNDGSSLELIIKIEDNEIYYGLDNYARWSLSGDDALGFVDHCKTISSNPTVTNLIDYLCQYGDNFPEDIQQGDDNYLTVLHNQVLNDADMDFLDANGNPTTIFHNIFYKFDDDGNAYFRIRLRISNKYYLISASRNQINGWISVGTGIDRVRFGTIANFKIGISKNIEELQGLIGGTTQWWDGQAPEQDLPNWGSDNIPFGIIHDNVKFKGVMNLYSRRIMVEQVQVSGVDILKDVDVYVQDPAHLIPYLNSHAQVTCYKLSQLETITPFLQDVEEYGMTVSGSINAEGKFAFAIQKSTFTFTGESIYSHPSRDGKFIENWDFANNKYYIRIIVTAPDMGATWNVQELQEISNIVDNIVPSRVSSYYDNNIVQGMTADNIAFNPDYLIGGIDGAYYDGKDWVWLEMGYHDTTLDNGIGLEHIWQRHVQREYSANEEFSDWGIDTYNKLTQVIFDALANPLAKKTYEGDNEKFSVRFDHDGNIRHMTVIIDEGTGEIVTAYPYEGPDF